MLATNQKDVILTLITVPDEQSASIIASMLVEQDLAACVNVIKGVNSFFKWQGRLNSEQEILLLVKTTRRCFEALKDEVLKKHPYELPEIIGVDVSEGFRGYLEWVAQETKHEQI